MTKWFDTNYHYIVPEFTADTDSSSTPRACWSNWREAKAQGVKAKPVIIGPVTYLWLGKAKDDSDSWRCCRAAAGLRRTAGRRWPRRASNGCRSTSRCWSPSSMTDWQHAFNTAYHELKASRVKLLLATYFGQLAGEPAPGRQAAGGRPAPRCGQRARRSRAVAATCCRRTRCCRWA